MKKLKTERGAWLLFLLHVGIGLAGIALVLIRLWDHPVSRLLFSCPSSFLHIYCPGCGGTRAISEMLKFHFISSIAYNPNPLLWAAALLYIDVRSLLILKRQGRLDRPYFSWSLFSLLVSVFFLNFIVRNLLLVLWDVDFIGDHRDFWMKFAPFAKEVLNKVRFL